MTLDPKILAEAQEVLRPYTQPAQKLIQDNLYGPREARLAGAIVKNAFTVVSYEAPTETAAFKTFRKDTWLMIDRLCKLLAQTTTIIEERVAHGDGIQELLNDCESAALTAEEDFEVEPDEDTPL